MNIITWEGTIFEAIRNLVSNRLAKMAKEKVTDLVARNE